MSKLLFLPDRNGREKESDGAGLVRLSADTSEMAALAKRMVIRQETDEITPDAAYQGAMALALLLDSWQGTDVRLAVRTIDAQKSRFASWVMAARPMEQRNQPIRLLILVKDQQEALLGLVDAENGLTLAAQMGDIWDMLPERATWVNREDKCFRSPLPLLPRAIGLVTSPGAAALHDVVTALRRRVPHIPVVLVPALVQGAAAPASLVATTMSPLPSVSG